MNILRFLFYKEFTPRLRKKETEDSKAKRACDILSQLRRTELPLNL